ncbi:MAG: hypothetical protein Q4E64_10965 [Phascolarctobacterium sp.]|uniref:hypothetical protein n=1 Tax=Phascolarctobacterium sp. TaxID=2049039 RepID=UPI0026DBF367|nr:hypothetical protein [Phascolarctobacterium sp.]MDO4922328.1 hypothetical protein [Phascolarctobacterium sp.]
MRRLLALTILLAAFAANAQAAENFYAGNPTPPTPAMRENRIASQQSQQRIERQADLQNQRTRDMQRDLDQKRK